MMEALVCHPLGSYTIVGILDASIDRVQIPSRSECSCHGGNERQE